MRNDEVKLRLQITEDKIEIMSELVEFKHKSNKAIAITASLTLLAVILIIVTRGRMKVLDVISVSILTTTLYTTALNMLVESRSDFRSLKQLEMEKAYYESLLND
jgi:hypothetical protein